MTTQGVCELGVKDSRHDLSLTEFEVRLLIDLLYPVITWGKDRKPLYDKLIKALGYKESHFETSETLKVKQTSQKIKQKYESMPDLKKPKVKNA